MYPHSSIAQKTIPNKKKYDKEEEWYKETIRAIMQYYSYNIAPNFFGEGANHVWKFISLFKYYFGEQDNISYKFMEEAAEGLSMPARWLPGKKLASLIDHMRGNFLKTLKAYDPNVYSLGRDAAAQKKEKWDDLMIEYELKEDLEQIEAEIGEKITLTDERPESVEDVEERMENFKTYSEKLIYSLARQTMNINHFEEKFAKLFVHSLIGVACLKVRVENGVVKWDTINPINLVYDMCDNDLQRDMQFAGHHYWASVGEIFEWFDLTDEEKQEVFSMAQNHNGNYRAQLEKNSVDWFWNKGNTEIYVKVFEGEWFYPENRNQLKKPDKYGNEHFKPTDKESNDDLTENQKRKGYEVVERPLNVVHKGSLIGNKILKNYGLRPNQPRSKSNLSETELSYHILTPGTELGRTIGPVQKLAQHQDNIDLYMYKIQEHIESDYGQTLMVDTSQLDPEVASDPSLLAARIKTDKMLPYNSAKDEMQMGGRANGNYFYSEDLSLSPAIQYYQNLIQQEIQFMEEAASIPKMALGQQQTYQPENVQKQAVQQSALGNFYHYKVFGSFVNKILQYSANVAKIVYTIDDNVFEKYNLGMGEIDFLDKLNKEDLAWEDFLVYIDVDDIMGDESKQRLIQQAQAAMQNQMLDWATYIEIEQSKTYSEALIKSRRAAKKMEQKQMKQQQIEMQKEQQKAKTELMKDAQLQKLKNQGALQEQQIENQGNIQEQGVQNQGDVLQTVIKTLADADQQERNRILQLLQSQQQRNSQNATNR